MTNRYICTVLDAMRDCHKTRNYSYLPGLIEEAQYLANKMESSLYDKNDYESLRFKIKTLKAKKKKLEKKVGTDDEDEN